MRTNHIYNLDCIEGLKTHILEESIDLCVTSPPYNVGIEYDNWNDTLRLEDEPELDGPILILVRN